MAIVTINDEHLTNIAAAIRGKNGTENTYKPSEMAAAISAISAGGGEFNMVELTHKGHTNTEGVKGFNVYDYVDDADDILFLMVRVGYDRTDYSNHMTYIKGYGFFIPKDTRGQYFSSSAPGAVLGAFGNPTNYGYSAATTFKGYQSSDNTAFGIKADGALHCMRSNYTSNSYTFNWLDFPKFYGTSSAAYHVWMIYK